MKKKIYLLLTCLLFSVSIMASPKNDSQPKKELTEQQQMRIQQIKDRVEEIKAMDKSALTKEQRQDLRKELTSMKKEAKAMGGGVYLSVGAIIIIILLLILILN